MGFKSLVRNLLGREAGKREKQIYSSPAHAKTKMGFITRGELCSSREQTLLLEKFWVPAA